MKTFETTHCRSVGHPEFRLAVDESRVIDPDIAFCIETLEGMVQDGQRFRDGETVQIGWCVLRVRASADGTLALLEPDFRHLPIAWVESVSSTLQHLRVQKDVCESFFDARALCFPSLRQSCIVCTALARAPQVILDRHEPEATDSGWFFGCSDGGHDHESVANLEQVSLYEAALQRPTLIPYLALPPGVLLQVTDDALGVLFHDGKPLQPKAGSYIAALRRAAQAGAGRD